MDKKPNATWVLWCGLALLGTTTGVVHAGPPALEGNCPICLVEKGQKVPGNPAYQLTIDRQSYLFASEDHLQKFKANAKGHVPVLAGDCPVCYDQSGQRNPGKLEYGMKYNGRLFLFASPQHQATFQSNPQKFINVDLGLSGNCPVTILEAQNWQQGNPTIQSTYDGFRYQFASEQAKTKFDANPAQYAPVLSGNCVVCNRDTGKSVAGSPYYAMTFEGRTYLFPNQIIRQNFLTNFAQYASVDLANQGNCPVCAKHDGRKTPGRREFLSTYKGMLYQFPNKEHRDRFDADPGLYAVAAPPRLPATQLGAAAPSNPAKLVVVTGKATCAYCDYRVRTKTDPESLGLGIINGDKVYLVERAEKLYPDIFEARYEGIDLEVIGHVTHVEDRFIWLEPVQVRRP